jgi:large subunit ribosomal protein L23
MTRAVKHPHVTEKTVDKMDFDNKMVFICDSEARKEEIVDELETQYNIDIGAINTMVTTSGEKKAEVQLTDDHDAQEIASRIGVF